MKKQILSIFALIIVFASNTTAQISTQQQPRSFKIDNVQIHTNNTIIAPVPDIEMLLKEEEQKANRFKPNSCAVLIPIKENFFDRAEKISLPDANLYILSIKSEGAFALNFYSNDFYIPNDCELYVWNPDKSKCLGAFTSDNNSNDGYFATDYVYDDEMIIEYYQPKNVKETAKLSIDKIGYFYNEIINIEKENFVLDEYNSNTLNPPYKGYRDSESCNVDINCSEGNNFRDVQRSVVRILIPLNEYRSGWCTGTLINNTNKDYTPYIISAGHCIEDVSNTGYFAQTIFYFNYEKSGCNNNEKEPARSSLVGADLLTHDRKYGVGSSDYLLFRLKNSIPQSYNAYWAGWSRSEELFRGCVGIHHPSGDAKKISTVDGAIQEIGYDVGVWDYDTHRMVRWKKTENGHGITEGGSSGSGLFNIDGLLIGTLSGGISSCSVPDYDKVDWYGRFDVTYEKLRQWLDPNSLYYIDFEGIDSKVDLEDMEMNLSLFPNPLYDKLTVYINNLNDNGVVSILDILGHSIFSDKITKDTNSLEIDMTNFANGTYFVRLYSKGKSVIKKVVKQ